MQTFLYALIAILMGAMMSVYLPMNSVVARYSGSPLTANIAFYVVGLLTSIVMLSLFGDFRTILKFRNVPPYLFLVGVMSAVLVLGTIVLIPKFGARKVFILLIAGQVIMAMIVSHLGILESPKDPITLRKLVGAALLVFGVVVSMAGNT